jgi:hypothetical protein
VRSLPGPVGSPMRLARPGSGWPGRSRRPGWLCGGGVVQAGTPTRGSGQDRPARCRTAGPVAAHWGAARGAGADPGRGGSPGSGPSPRRRPRGSDAGPPPAVEAAAAPGAGLCRGGLDPGARPLAGQRGGGAGPAGLRVAFDEAHGAVLAVQARRDRLEAPSPSRPPPRPGRRWWPGWAVCAGSGC